MEALTKTERTFLDLVDAYGGFVPQSLVGCYFKHPVMIVRMLERKGIVRQTVRDGVIGFVVVKECAV